MDPIEPTDSETIEKRKKGRPKKNVNEENTPISVDEDKKKRGRKKKEQLEEEIKVKKKRGRKAALKYFNSSIRKQIPLKTNIVDNDNNILFLDVKESELNTDDNIKNLNLKDINLNNLNESNNILHDMNLNDSNLNELNLNELNLNELNLNELNLNELNLNDSNNGLTNESCGGGVKHSSNIYNESKTSLHDNDIINQSDNIKKGFFKMFNYFENWIEKTDIKCWWCCHNFDTLPIGYPVAYNNALGKFRVKGVFCSFSCMLAHAKEIKDFKVKLYLIKHLYKKLTGHCNILFKEAPPKTVLKDFGGHLTIEEFRQLSNEHKTYSMIVYPMYQSRDYIAEVDLTNIRQINTNVFKNEINTSLILDDKKIEEVKQRVSKINQKVVATNSIESFIKF